MNRQALNTKTNVKTLAPSPPSCFAEMFKKSETWNTFPWNFLPEVETKRLQRAGLIRWK
jgi:hypothetical protein